MFSFSPFPALGPAVGGTLTELHLDKNKIQTVNASDLQNFTVLEVLVLNKNRLTEVCTLCGPIVIRTAGKVDSRTEWRALRILDTAANQKCNREKERGARERQEKESESERRRELGVFSRCLHLM